MRGHGVQLAARRKSIETVPALEAFYDRNVLRKD